MGFGFFFDFFINSLVQWFDGDSRQLILEGEDKKTIVTFEKCLLATGELPVGPSFTIDDSAPVTHLNTVFFTASLFVPSHFD